MSDYSYFCGIDLAKNHFSLHAVDQNGKVILHKSMVSRRSGAQRNESSDSGTCREERTNYMVAFTQSNRI